MRRTLLDAALAAFAERGYDGTSLRDLARRVGVSHNLVHHHYGSKWELWKAALGHALAASGRELFALVEASSRQPDWQVANRDGITGAVMLFARHPAVARIMADESARGGPRLDFLFERYIEPFGRLLEKLVGAAPRPAGRSHARTIDARAAMLFLFAGMTAPFTLAGLAAKLGGSAPASDEDLDRFAATVAELVAHGLARPPARREA
ncbi:MAG: helix-turn-helix domain-containing protein [Thermodesulfobacteriota bacterium]